MRSHWLSRCKYQALLLAVIMLLAVYPILHGPAQSPILARILLTVVFLAGGSIVFTDRRLWFFAFLLGGPSVLAAWTDYALPDIHTRIIAAVFHSLAAAFHLFVIVVLLRGVYSSRSVSGDVVAAALCGYLLLGVSFGHAYCLVDEIIAGSFRGIEPGSNAYSIHEQLTYFSFMTLTTVGYGDITPARDTARSLAMVEGVVGQFYMAVLVAELIGKRVAQALAGEPGE